MANDDDNNSGPQSTLTYLPTVSGIYYLAIAGSSFAPVSVSGLIFPAIDFVTVQPGELRGPTGPGGANPLSGWVGTSYEYGNYDIALTGALAGDPTAVPEPSTAVLPTTVGVLLACFKLRRRAKNALVALLAVIAAGVSYAQPTDNMGLGLRELVAQHDALGSIGPLLNPNQMNAIFDLGGGLQAVPAAEDRMDVDASNRILVEIYLDGTVSISQATAALTALGANVTGTNPNYRNGVIDAYIPVGSANAVATLAGVRTVNLSLKPQTNVGRTTDQGAKVQQTDVANSSGYTGLGITVGVMSDSFNTSTSTIKYADDVASGDLPTMKYIVDYTATGTIDEGRAMAQIVYDLAPRVGLCFSTAYGGQATFAAHILDLRTNPACSADVIVDDVVYYAEPMFSDGQIAQAVDTVSTTPAGVMAGRPVSYFSSAGNQARNGYTSDFRLVDNTTARGLSGQGVNLSTIPITIDTTGGFHNFNTSGSPLIAQTVTLASSPNTFILQWDDPFDLSPSGITTDYDLIVFSNGNYLFSAAASNFSTNQPIESITITGTGTLQLVISRRATGTKLANRLKWVAFGSVSGPTLLATNAVTYGHSAAANANSVAAYIYSYLPVNTVYPTDPGFPYKPLYESFSAPGPVTIAFDKNGSRLSGAETRKKPDMASIDGGNNTFFGSDFEAPYSGAADGFPNFFGTSAAAPHAAAIAALMLQKGGGPGSLSSPQVRSYMQTTAPARDTDKFFAKATGTNAGATVTITASGNLNSDPNFFSVTLSGDTGGRTLNSITLNMAGADIVLSTNSAQGGNPFILGATTGPVATAGTSGDAITTFPVSFTGFTGGNTVNFGVGRRFLAYTGAPRSRFADLMAGATFTATLSGGGTITGTFVNTIAKGYTVYDGYGIVDAVSALAKVP